MNSFSIKNINESSIAMANPAESSKRNFYLQLFRTYCDLPGPEILSNFHSIYSDVFFKERPFMV